VSLATQLNDRIKQYGPITVADYMRTALLHPEFGYYTRKDPLGIQGDFITAPEISQIFGELIGLWLAEQWRILGKPESIIVEPGPGRGTLMADIIRATQHVQGFHDAISIHFIEGSPVLREKQKQALKGHHPRVQWHTDFKKLPAKPLLLAANEFFDALPVRQFMYAADGWCERMVNVDAEGKLHFILVREIPPVDFPAVSDVIFEYGEDGAHITRTISTHIRTHGGAGVIVDYGFDGGSRGDTLQAVKNHKFHDTLHDPGTADLSCHVDFERMKRNAEAQKVAAYGPVTQGAFLNALGAKARAAILCKNAPHKKASVISGLERLLSPDTMGHLFKVLCIVPMKHPKPEGF